MNPAATRPRFLLLDFLRILAALSVLGYHYTARYHTQWGVAPIENFQFISKFTAYGALGVQLFFIISGFVILLSAEGRTLGQFVSARVARLFPAYWIAVLTTALLVIFIAPQLEREVSGTEVLLNLTMTQKAYGVQSVDGAYWTLWVELLFYVMIALLISIRLTEAKVYAFAFLWPLVSGIAQNLPEPGLLAALLSPKYASLFAGGMLLYLIHSRGHNLLRWLLLAFNVSIAAYQTVTFELFGAAFRHTGMELSGTLGAALVVLLFGVVTLVTVTPLKYRGWSWMTYAGALTYPLYLMHESWGWWIIGLTNPTLGKWGALFAAVAFSFVAAMIIERWIERPLRPIIRRGLQKSFDSINTAPRVSPQPNIPAARRRSYVDISLRHTSNTPVYGRSEQSDGPILSIPEASGPSS